MRILQVCPSPYMDNQGITVHVKNVAECLAKRHDVTVFAAMDSNSHLRYEVVNGVKVERFRCFTPFHAYSFTVDMPLRMRQVEFDVVHAHGYHALPFHLSLFAKGDKLIVTPHFHGVGHSSFRNAVVRAFRFVGKQTMNRADKILAVSEFEKSLICEHFGLDADRISVVPNGVLFKDFEGLRKRGNANCRRVLYVGYLASFKGAQYLVEVLPKLAEDVVLEIVGRGPLRGYLEKRAHELGVEDRVRFNSYVERFELLQMFADADVFCLPSRYEAYSIVVAEALAARTPVVVTRTSALSEWVDGESVFGVEFPVRLGELAERLSCVLDHGGSSLAMRRWFGSKILDWAQVADRIEKIYLG